MSRMLSKMNLISVVQQLPKEDIEIIQGYVEMIENENNKYKEEIDKLKNIIRKENKMAKIMVKVKGIEICMGIGRKKDLEKLKEKMIKDKEKINRFEIEEIKIV